MKRLIALVLLVPTLASAQQATDPATLQRYLTEMQRMMMERTNDAVVARAESARLSEELAKVKARIQELEKKD